MFGAPRWPMCPLKWRRQALRTAATFALRERQEFLDPVDHGLVDLAYLAELALALRTLGRSEMAQAWLTTQDLACGGHFQPLGSRFLRLATCDGSWHNLGRRTLGIELRLSTAFYTGKDSDARNDRT